MKFIIDRFEGKYAVCEKDDNTIINIEKVKLPENVKEGDIIIMNSEKAYIDLNETRIRKSRIKKFTEDIWI